MTPYPLLMPPRLRPGDTIGIVLPAGPVREPERAEQGIGLLRQMGFQVRLPAAEAAANEYLAAPDPVRIRQLHALWADEEVKAIMAMRGGYGCLRIAPLLDIAFLRRHPKWLIGFSDLTVLHAVLGREAGLVSVHGPMVTTLGRTNTKDLQALWPLLAGETPPLREEVEVLRKGICRGRLAGGNLSCLVSLLGTPWEIEWQESILLLEDTGEPMYRLDRMLTQLALSGRLASVRGILLGDFTHPSGDRLESMRLQEDLWQRVLELTPEDLPVWGGFPTGHGQRNRPLPLGMEATMDEARATLGLHPESVQRTDP